MSEFSRAKHREFGFEPEMDVLPYFLPDPVAPPGRGPLKSPHDRPYFLFVGRLETIKGLDTVIPVFRDYPAADLLVAGDGTQATALNALAAGSPRVRFLGRLSTEALASYYRHALALIVPSVGFETFGIILIEAFQNGTPVIARRIGPFPEIVDLARAGELFSSSAELVAAMRRIQEDPAYRETLARNGSAAVRRHWTESAVVPRYLDIVASRRRPPRYHSRGRRTSYPGPAGGKFLMRILITGGAGFLGSHLAERLLARGHDVLVLDDLSTGQMANLAGLVGNRRFAYRIGSVTDRPLVAELVDLADVTVHLAAAVGVRLIIERPVHTIETNVHGTEVVLACAAKKEKRVIVASTSEVYGKGTKVPFSEEDDLTLGATHHSRWAYACSKALDEWLALAYWRERRVPVTICRFFNTVGPRQTGRYGMVLPTLTAQALRGEPITVFGVGRADEVLRACRRRGGVHRAAHGNAGGDRPGVQHRDCP